MWFTVQDEADADFPRRETRTEPDLINFSHRLQASLGRQLRQRGLESAPWSHGALDDAQSLSHILAQNKKQKPFQSRQNQNPESLNPTQTSPIELMPDPNIAPYRNSELKPVLHPNPKPEFTTSQAMNHKPRLNLTLSNPIVSLHVQPRRNQPSRRIQELIAQRCDAIPPPRGQWTRVLHSGCLPWSKEPARDCVNCPFWKLPRQHTQDLDSRAIFHVPECTSTFEHPAAILSR